MTDRTETHYAAPRSYTADTGEALEPTPERILDVARAHGTPVAAEWGGVSTGTVTAWRKEVDGYDRGRGHPTRAEMAAMAPRWDCTCCYCASTRSHAQHRSNLAHSATEPGKALIGDRDPWRQHAACIDEEPTIFFPTRGESPKPAKAICDTCPVQFDCLDFAITNNITNGIWGGKSERARRSMRRRTLTDGAAS